MSDVISALEHRLDLLEQELDNQRLIINTQQVQIKKLSETVMDGRYHSSSLPNQNQAQSSLTPGDLQRELNAQRIVIQKQQLQIKRLNEALVYNKNNDIEQSKQHDGDTTVDLQEPPSSASTLGEVHPTVTMTAPTASSKPPIGISSPPIKLKRPLVLNAQQHTFVTSQVAASNPSRNTSTSSSSSSNEVIPKHSILGTGNKLGLSIAPSDVPIIRNNFGVITNKRTRAVVRTRQFIRAILAHDNHLANSPSTNTSKIKSLVNENSSEVLYF